MLFYDMWFLRFRVDYIVLVYFILFLWNKYILFKFYLKWNVVLKYGWILNGFFKFKWYCLKCGFIICEVILLIKNVVLKKLDN